MRRWSVVGAIVALYILVPATALASVGVGVGTGRIQVSEKLRSGGIYTLPPITVFNTGTETATYTMAVTLNEQQPQLKPDPKWFSFSPNKFTLAAHESQRVIPIFHPPLATKPGNYFAYLEAHPYQTVKQGTATIGVAAATKLSFTVVQSNLFLAILFRLFNVYKYFSPWSYIASVIIVVVILVALFRRHFQISFQRKKTDT